MTFDTVVFGSYIVGTGFTNGSAISTGGLRCFIKPTANIGNAPLDVTITYIDQFGNTAETTVVSTSVAARTTSGNHIEVVLNAGDSGIRDVTNVTVTGGTTGDRFNLESWNEGLGKTFQAIVRSDANPPYLDADPKRDAVPIAQSWMGGETLDVTLTDVILGGTISDANFTLVTETIEPDYGQFNEFGFLAASVNVSGGDKQIWINPYPGAVAAVDANESSKRFKWRWVSGAYLDKGFFQIDFDFALLRGSLFTFEVLDKDGIVKFTRASNTGGWTASPTINSYCGQETLYPASNSRDNNTSTVWRHYTDETHWIIYDLGTTARCGGIKIWFDGLSSGWITSIEASDDLVTWTSVYDGLDIKAGAMWYPAYWIPIKKRYWRVYIDPYVSNDSLDGFVECQFYLFEHQTLNFKSLAFEVRLRASTSGTAAGTEYLDLRNLQITRYKDTGSIESHFAMHNPNLKEFDELLFGGTYPTGTNTRFQLAFSDDGITWSDFTGYDGTNATAYAYIGQAIIVPAGYTGYYYKWKAYCNSDGRETPICDSITIWLWVYVWKIAYDLIHAPTIFMSPQNEQMRPHITWKKGCPRITAGYPAAPCSGGLFLPETLTGSTFTGRVYVLIKGTDWTWIAEIQSGHNWIARILTLAQTWLEAVVGQVLSGYVKDQNEQIILDGLTIIITSTYTEGRDQMGAVNPETGFYQVFVKNTKYDGRFLTISLSGRTYNVTYRTYGLPALIDGMVIVPVPTDLHFWRPENLCGKSVAYVGSLVTY